MGINSKAVEAREKKNMVKKEKQVQVKTFMVKKLLKNFPGFLCTSAGIKLMILRGICAKCKTQNQLAIKPSGQNLQKFPVSYKIEISVSIFRLRRTKRTLTGRTTTKIFKRNNKEKRRKREKSRNF